MNESQFITSIHRKLHKDVFRWKISDRFTAGIADAYYSGVKGDLWIEYKFAKNVPKMVLPNLSALQVKWLAERYKEGRNVAVIYGTPKHCMIYRNRAWEIPMPKNVFVNNSFTRADIIDWIENNVL